VISSGLLVNNNSRFEQVTHASAAVTPAMRSELSLLGLMHPRRAITAILPRTAAGESCNPSTHQSEARGL
jgi:hypothetical protein